jgi:hypothetical protein
MYNEGVTHRLPYLTPNVKNLFLLDVECFTPPSENLLSQHFTCQQRGHATERNNVANIKTTDFVHRQEKPPIKRQNVKTTAEIFLRAPCML